VQPQVAKGLVEKTQEGSTSHTFHWAWQFEVIQVTIENVFTKFIRISHDPNEQIAAGQFTLLESRINQEPDAKLSD
jgi:hypothetical protein